MINIYTVLGILAVHWLADFVLQTDKQAKGKSNNWIDLLGHTVNYTLTFFIVFAFYAAFCLLFVDTSAHEMGLDGGIFWFFPITFAAHTITDYFTSRLNSKLWANGEVHNFFVSIGFDQWLHYAQLLLTYHFLTT